MVTSSVLEEHQSLKLNPSINLEKKKCTHIFYVILYKGT